MKNGVLQLIKNSPHDKSLSLIDKEIGDGDIEQVIKAIVEHKPHLQELHLDNNKLGDQGARKLAQHLPNLHDLTLLSIQYNQIGEVGAALIFAVRDKLPKLDILFRGNKIKDMGIMHDIEQTSGSSFRSS